MKLNFHKKGLITKQPRPTLENTIKKIKNVHKFNKIGFSFLEKLLQCASRSVILKV